MNDQELAEALGIEFCWGDTSGCDTHGRRWWPKSEPPQCEVMVSMLDGARKGIALLSEELRALHYKDGGNVCAECCLKPGVPHWPCPTVHILNRWQPGGAP